MMIEDYICRCHEQEGTILKLKAESNAHKEEMAECERTLKDTVQTEMKVGAMNLLKTSTFRQHITCWESVIS